MREHHLREVLGELGIEVIARNGSGWLVSHCPFAPLGFHRSGRDREPSFFTHPNNSGPSGFNCFTCKQKGTIPELIQQLSHNGGDMTFMQAAALANRARVKEMQVEFNAFGEWTQGEEPPEPLDPSLFAGVYPDAWTEVRAREYLEARGVTEEASTTMRLLYDPEGMRVMFPVYDYDYRLFGFSGRSVLPDDERRMTKVKDYAGLRKTWHLLGEQLVGDSDREREAEGKKVRPILVVEGLFAFAHMVSIGARQWVNPVATLGSFLSRHQRDALVNLDRPVYFLYDDDLAGDIGLYGRLDKEGQHDGGGAIGLLKRHLPVHICNYPERFREGEGDPDKLTLDDLYWILREGSALAL